MAYTRAIAAGAAAAQWCREQGRAVIERPIRLHDLAGGAPVYGNALIGLVPAFAVEHPEGSPPGWFDVSAIERRLAE